MKTEISNQQFQHKNNNSNLKRGKKMKYFSIILTVMVTALIGRNTDETTGWEYDASTQQAFYMFANIEVDDVDVEVADVLGAFKDGQCIGFTNAIPSDLLIFPLRISMLASVVALPKPNFK